MLATAVLLVTVAPLPSPAGGAAVAAAPSTYVEPGTAASAAVTVCLHVQEVPAPGLTAGAPGPPLIVSQLASVKLVNVRLVLPVSVAVIW